MNGNDCARVWPALLAFDPVQRGREARRDGVLRPRMDADVR
ncbi:hypothetical protein [Methylacidimicrobium tartarophylax]|nr:hypothetical protein [Methylacidimicrobium tartarophylax]